MNIFRSAHSNDVAKYLVMAVSVYALTFPLATAQEPQAHGEVDPSALRLLIGDELLAEFSGKTRIGIYKRPFARSGSSRYTETTHANGRTDYKEGDFTATGIWKAAGDRMCFRYDSSPEDLHCFREFKTGNCVYSYTLSNSTVNGPIDPNRWGSKSVIKGDVSTCDDLLG